MTLVITALVAAGCTSGSAPDAAEPVGAPEPTGAPSAWDTDVTWQPCPELPEEALDRAMPAGLLPGIVNDLLVDLAVGLLTADRTYECATLPVPQEWSTPDSGETFEIALVRIRTRAQHDRIGSLVVNPGGPGASGVDAAAQVSLPPLVGGLPDEVTSRFDIVGFDPRGVARSSPVECFTDADLDEMFGGEPDPVAQAEFDAAVADSERRTEACDAKYGEALRHYSTRQTAHDLDAVRAAVGDEQLTYLGYSYGTLLGAVYAHLYPGHVRALVLDGAVDPRQDSITGAERQAAGFERAFDNFAGWCDASPDECPLGSDTRATVTGAIEAARRSPVPGADGREATAGWVLWAVIASLYQRDLWPLLGAALDKLDGGDPSGVFTLADIYTGRDADGSYSNLFEALTAISCTDEDAERTVAQARDLQQQWRGEYPLFGAPLATSLLDCALWPGDRDPYPTGPADGAPPILVVGTTGDPATPYESTAALAEMLGTGVVLTWEGEGHTVYPQQGCVSELVNVYLVDLTVPDVGTICTRD